MDTNAIIDSRTSFVTMRCSKLNFTSFGESLMIRANVDADNWAEERSRNFSCDDTAMSPMSLGMLSGSGI